MRAQGQIVGQRLVDPNGGPMAVNAIALGVRGEEAGPNPRTLQGEGQKSPGASQGDLQGQ